MDWETLLGLVGLYIIALCILVYGFWVLTKIQKIARLNQKILQVMKTMVAEDVGDRIEKDSSTD